MLDPLPVRIQAGQETYMPQWLRRFFRVLNKYFMVPMFRLGLGPVFGNPLSGYIMVIKNIGRISGRLLYTPVNYAIYQGNIYCVSGGRKSSDWYRNLVAHPTVELILPSGAIYARMEEEEDPEVRLKVIRRVLKNAGFAGFFEGYNPWSIGDAELEKKISGLPLLRFHPLGIGSGAADSGGGLWILFGFLLLVGAWIVIYCR